MNFEQIDVLCADINALRRLSERLERELQEARDFIVNNKPRHFTDWACRECAPASDILQEGFVCQYHLALAAQADKGA